MRDGRDTGVGQAAGARINMGNPFVGAGPGNAGPATGASS